MSPKSSTSTLAPNRPPVAAVPAVSNAPPVAHLPEVSNVPALGRLPAGLKEYLDQTPGLCVDFSGPHDALATLDHGRQLQAQGAIVTGYALTWLRGALEHGEWRARLAERHISKSTAQRMMAVFRFACRLSELGAVSALAELGATKMLAFQDWDDDEIRELMAGDEVRGLTYDQAAEQSSRELESQIKAWRKDHDLALQKAEKDKATLAAKLDIAELEAQQLRAQLDGRQVRGAAPDWYRYLRHDALVHTEAMAQQLLELEQAVNENVVAAPRSTDDETTYARMAADTVLHTLGGVLASAQALAERVAEFGSGDLGDEVQLLRLRISDEELQMLARNRAQITRQMELDKTTRRWEREMEGKRSVGRPRKAPHERKDS